MTTQFHTLSLTRRRGELLFDNDWSCSTQNGNAASRNRIYLKAIRRQKWEVAVSLELNNDFDIGGASHRCCDMMKSMPLLYRNVFILYAIGRWTAHVNKWKDFYSTSLSAKIGRLVPIHATTHNKWRWIMYARIKTIPTTKDRCDSSNYFALGRTYIDQVTQSEWVWRES